MPTGWNADRLFGLNADRSCSFYCGMPTPESNQTKRVTLKVIVKT